MLMRYLRLIEEMMIADKFEAVFEMLAADIEDLSTHVSTSTVVETPLPSKPQQSVPRWRFAVSELHGDVESVQSYDVPSGRMVSSSCFFMLYTNCI